MLPVGPEKPSDSASLIAWRSIGEARRQPHAPVRPGRAGRPLLGEHQEEHAVGAHRGQGEPGGAPDVLGDRAVQEVGDVHLAALERGGARGLLGDAADHQALDARGLAPVAVEGLERELDPRLEAHELVRPGADGRLAEAVLADPLEVLLGHDPRRAGRARAVEGHEVRPRVLQVEADAARVHHLHVANPVLQDRRGRAPVALEGELHVLRGDRIAVVEARALAEHELPGAPVLRHASTTRRGSGS